MNFFRILTYEEEMKLSISNRIKYYEFLKDYFLKNQNSFLNLKYIDFCEFLNRYLVREIVNKTKGYDLTITGLENITSSPVIYASTHQDFHDHFNLILGIPEHTIILNNTNIAWWMKVLLSLNGVVFVDRNDSKSKFNSKLELMKQLANGKSIVIFPEATYNCSPNKLHLGLYSGVIDIARKMQVPIIPIVQEYEYDKEKTKYNSVLSCQMEFGSPIYVGFKDDIYEKKEELSEQFSTIRWNLMERKGIYSRKSISEQEYINYILSRKDSYKKAQVKEDDELKALKGFGEEQYLFRYINAIDFDNYGNLLVPNEVRKLEQLNSRHIDKYFDRDGNYVDFTKILSRIP